MIRGWVFKSVVALLLSACVTGFAKADSIQWPSLPTTGYLIHRTATTNDVNSGTATFTTSEDGTGGSPLDITSPQYGFLISEGAKQPVIVIQAEYSSNGIKLIGAKSFKGEFLVGLFDDFELLGTEIPK